MTEYISSEVTLRDARKRAGLTQAELADLMGVQQVTVSQWERVAWPTIDKLPALALALGLSMEELVGVLIRTREGS